ncbi:hypothetical protein [uncultured Amphritea sp.]|uniref:hypothetical protein n=1 Tax=uncultured Amphritea sp. TaxID=981605 RepID=UPI002611830D|nr:hypothetical protein [uncultured Amphritea sp.]
MNTKTIIQASLSTLLITLCLTGLARAADIQSQAAAISIAAEQRTLTQVMLKNYLLSGLGIRARKADQELAGALQQFTAQQQQLVGFVTDAQVQQQLALMSESWKTVQQQYRQTPNKQRFKTLYSGNEALLSQGDVMLNKVVQSKADDSAQPLSLLGQQELLCQQLVVIYAMTAWGVASEADLSYDAISADLLKNMALLQALPQNTAEINDQLQRLSNTLEQTLEVSKARPGALLPALVDRSVVKAVLQLQQLRSEYLSLAGANNA